MDLFTNVSDAAAFRGAVQHVAFALGTAGYTVEDVGQTDMLATLIVKDAEGAVGTWICPTTGDPHACD